MKWLDVPFACLAALGLCLFLGSFATAGRADVAEDRAAAMKHVRNGYRALVDMAKSGEFDAAAAKSGADQIAAGLAKFKDMFPKGSEHVDKISSPEIWSDRAGFDAAWAAARDAASQVSAVTEAAAYIPAVRELATACRNCHKKFVLQDN